MEREQALQKFKDETAELISSFREQISRHLLERGDRLESMIFQAMNDLGERMKQQEKEYVSFLYISVLKVDVLNRNYRFFLQGMNHRWYLDEEPAEVYFSAEDLYDPLNELWDNLIEKTHWYMGAINSYDIQHIIFEEIKFIDSTIAQILRYRLCNWEEKKLFADVTLAPYWLLKWGEYRDQAEFILHTDRTEQEEGYWRQEIRKAIYKPEQLVFSYWYRGLYQDSELTELDLKFAVFEEARLENVQFNRCDMEGCRFTGSTLANCSFTGCNLWGADFTAVSFENVSFSGANLTGAILPADSVPFLNLEPEQLQAVLLRREDSE